MASINVNSTALKNWSANLDKLGKADLPVAVRSTLNNAAFDMKQRTLPLSARNNFKDAKRPQFFRTFSGVDRARGLDISKMRSTMGMLAKGRLSARTAVEHMVQQEFGGAIDDGLAYLKSARGEKINGVVRRENYYDKSKVISGRSRVGRNKGTRKSKFVARAYRSLKEKKPMFINSAKGNYLMKVIAISKTTSGKVTIKSKLILKERETIRIKSTGFLTEAGAMTQKRIPEFYIIEAKKRIAKTMK